MKHTPIPFRLEKIGISNAHGVDVFEIIAANGERIATVAGSDAAFIVQACNSHDQNVAKIADLVEALERFTNPHTTIHGARVVSDADIAAANAALKHAKGEI